MYWRGPVLWNFDGRTWTSRDGCGAFRAPVRSTARTGITNSKSNPPTRAQLVALDLPPSRRMARACRSITASTHAGRVDIEPMADALRAACHVRAATQVDPAPHGPALPPGYNPRTIALAQRWRREAGGNDVAVVDRAMR
jgi:hypothetical protein